MGTPAFDPVRYKADQRRNWDALAAGWYKWWHVFERGAQPVSDRLVDLAGVGPGQRVLDVATGIGEPAVTAARRVGPTGRVLAVDQAPRMLAMASERTAALGLRHVEFREIDAEALDVPENAFDAVVCRWGLMFLPDLPGALGRMRRALSPGGRLAAAVWSVPHEVPMISLPMRVVREKLDVPPPPPGTPTPFSLADPDVLRQALARAGFTRVRTERLTVTMEFPSVEEYVGFQREIGGQLAAAMADQPAERRDEVWRGIAEAVRRYAAPDGSVRLANQTICVVAQG